MLSYHRVVEDYAAEQGKAIAGLLLSGETLRRQVDDLWRAGYEPTSLDDALEMMAGSRHPKKDAVVFTFDDGYRDVHDVAFPLLERLGIPAVVYLPTHYIDSGKALPHDRLYDLLAVLARRTPEVASRVANRVPVGRDARFSRPMTLEEAVDAILRGRPHKEIENLVEELQVAVGGFPIEGRLLTWDMCRHMVRSGFTFGAHTRSHSSLHLLTPEELRAEIRGSKADVERELGRPCRHFAYPNGYYNDAVIREVVDAGFASAVTTEDLANRIGTDPFRIKRKTLWENHSQGMLGYSPALTACQVDNIFGMIGLVSAVPGQQPRPPKRAWFATQELRV